MNWIELLPYAGAAASSIAAAVSILLLRRRRAPPAPSPLSPEEQARRDEELVRQRELERQRYEEDRRRREEEQRRLAAEEARLRQEAERRLAELAREAVSHVVFTTRMIQVGVVKTGERVVGVIPEESPTPADDLDVRPIRNIAEIGDLLPAEQALDPDLLEIRVLTGEAIVRQHIVATPVMEDVFEPRWEVRRQALYLLLDVSPSMYPEWSDWKMPVWKAIGLSLLEHCLEAEAIFLEREFDQGQRDLIRVVTATDAAAMRQRILGMQYGAGTRIGPAIQAAITDFANESYDQADMVVLTDGEDDAIAVDELRAALDQAHIRLHAILLGTENEKLRSLADVYQVIERGPKLHPPVRRL